tara:strand:+ start:4830 stop:5399 length:570 start_codon:yes stop_codon:yes gene_type:complete
LLEVLDTGEIDYFQLRLKNYKDVDFLNVAETLKPLCDRTQTLLIINDRPDLAKAVQADGVHIGQNDTNIVKSREILGDNAIIGVTCHNSIHLGFLAAESSANYVAFGAFFHTKSKETKYKAELALIQQWNMLVEIPLVAIGGITPENCGPIVKAGVDYIAIMSAVWDNIKGPSSAILEFKKKIKSKLVD